MGVIALMGGDEFRQDCIPLDRVLLGMAKEARRVVVVPTAAAFESPGRAAENGIRYFDSLGATSTAAMILNRSDAEDPALLGRLEGADLAYLTGGSPAHLLRSLSGSGAAAVLARVLQRGGVIVGSSAGAMALGQVMRGDTAGTWVPGLGLAPGVAVRPHHPPDSALDPRSVCLGLDYNVRLLGIPVATACISDGGTGLRVVGTSPVVVYSHDGVERYQPGDTFTLSGA